MFLMRTSACIFFRSIFFLCGVGASILLMRTPLKFLFNRVGAPMKNECVGAHYNFFTLVCVCRHVNVNSVLFNFQNLFSHGH